MKIPIDKKIILFDGFCNLCSSQVNFIIKRDCMKHFLFASLQSKTGQKILSACSDELKNTDSIIMIDNKGVYTESTAVIKIAKYLKSPWNLFYVFIIFPKFIRSAIYRLIAKNRYKWFGKKQVCFIPDEDMKIRFLQ